MNCTYCNKKVTLVPSAEARAKKFGGQPSDYTRLFATHADCVIEERQRSVSELIARDYSK